MEAERQAINSPIQGFIGDYKAAVMVEIHEEVDRSKFRLVGEHHDAVLGIVRTKYKKRSSSSGPLHSSGILNS